MVAGWPTCTWICFAAWLGALALFVSVERRVEGRGGSPLVSLRLFRQRTFTVGIALVLVAYASLYSFFLILSLVLQNGLRLSHLESVLAFTPEAMTFFVVGTVAGRLVPRYGRRVLEVGAIVPALGFAATILVARY